MKRLLAAAALAAALSCSAAGTQDIQKHGEEYFRIFSILPDGQGILARRCTKLTRCDGIFSFGRRVEEKKIVGHSLLPTTLRVSSPPDKKHLR